MKSLKQEIKDDMRFYAWAWLRSIDPALVESHYNTTGRQLRSRVLNRVSLAVISNVVFVHNVIEYPVKSVIEYRSKFNIIGAENEIS